MNRNKTHRLAALLLALLTAMLLLPLPGVQARNSEKIVRVGWYESPFNQTDELGRRSGYAYDYQQKIAAYTGWEYEYVVGSWPELLEMLEDGRIDLLSDVSYTPERAEQMLFPSLPMGAEDYYIYTAPNNREITLDDLSTFNGKKVGINKGSVQIGFFNDWAAANGVTAQVIEMTQTTDQALAMLHAGEIDMYVVLDAYWDASVATPICKVGASDFYFAVSKDRPELLSELNSALNRIQAENPVYNQELNKHYITSSATNRHLSSEELAWLNDHGTIRVGYQDGYLAFCASDPETGELTGALSEYLRVASDSMENAHIDFEAIAYPSAGAALDALRAGEVDCMFPCNLTLYDGESQGVLVSPPLMNTDMTAIIRKSELTTFSQKDRVTVAVNAGNTNYELFLMDHFPDWRPVYYPDTPTGLKAISEGRTDCLLMSNYRYNNVAAQCEKLNLTTLSTGISMDYCFGVNRGETELYSILSKVTDVVPVSTVNAALTFYYTEDAQRSMGDMLKEHMGVVVGVLAAVAALFLYLLLRNARAERKARQEHKLITAMESDPMTGLYNKNFFYEYAHQLRQEHPEKAMDAIVLNIDQFHSVNAINGRTFGDQVLRAMGEEIQRFLAETEGIGSRSEPDHFAIYCTHLEDYQGLLDRLQSRMDRLSSNAIIQLRMGVMPWQKELDAHQQIEQALVACNMARSNTEHLVVVDDVLRRREAYEQQLISDLRRALEDGEFEVYYQPKYDIQTDPPQMKSVEALARWRHPELGLISPGDFIPLFERNGRIGEVDKYIWSQAARQVAVWKEKFGVTVPVSVNLSRVDVFDPTLGKTLDALMKENGLACGELKLEVTESACTENPLQVINVIERLRKKGYEIEMDDFGTGYSSLNMLSGMPVDVLKMDRAFVSNIEFSQKDMQLVELILSLAKNLKIPVIAEGVETESQLNILKEMGCELVQGYYFSRPLPPEVFEETYLFKNVD